MNKPKFTKISLVIKQQYKILKLDIRVCPVKFYGIHRNVLYNF